MRRIKDAKEVPFHYSYHQFRNMIKKTKESKTAPPSGRHWGYYKTLLEMEDNSMLYIIFNTSHFNLKVFYIKHHIAFVEKRTS